MISVPQFLATSASGGINLGRNVIFTSKKSKTNSFRNRIGTDGKLLEHLSLSHTQNVMFVSRDEELLH